MNIHTVIRCSRGMSLSRSLITFCFRAKIPLMMMGDFFEKQYQFADQFNILKLDDAEIGLLTSVLIMNPGNFHHMLV
jgi:hypothetical protein